MNAERVRPGWTRAAAVIGALALGALGCAASLPRSSAAPPPVAGHPRVALLPLENLSGKSGADDLFGRVLFAEIVRTGCCDLIEPGRVESALDTLGIRSTGALTPADARRLAASLGAKWLLIGSVLELGTARTPEGEVPSAAATLRMIEPDSAKVLWAGSAFRTGEDREMVFGFGREVQSERLQAAVAAELVKPFRTAAKGGGR